MKNKVKIIGFLCNWCSYAGADLAGSLRLKYSSSFIPVKVMCSGRVDINHILEVLKNGADGVIIGGCHLGECHYKKGNYFTLSKYKFLIKILKQFGINEKRVKLVWVNASEGKRFAKIINDMTEELANLKDIIK